MSGHNKWSSIKHKKGAADAQRGKLFSRLARELTVAAREGGGEADTNPRLRTVIGKCKEANMPADNIQRAIKKGTGELPGVVYEEVMYEGYGQGGVALLIQALTDNKNRTTGEVRSTLNKRGGNLAGAGSVAWQFSSKGYIVVEKEKGEEETVMNIVIEAGAEDFVVEDSCYEITTEPMELERVKQALENAGVVYQSAELTMVPASTVKVEGSDAKTLLGLISALEDCEDVQNVYANFDISDELLEELSSE
ncbi:MAG: YebC/PmpR family DNA-binding transcriptional regulator [Candidatus Omnitrophica bacterium]|nr:YebC/PmpR family DNA-binding transcriptional regulator [Candidatus Omnitrophota bacterium]